jgi:hypothetical protein
MRRKEELVSTEVIPGKKYTGSELNAIADQLLRDDSRSELCRECKEKGFLTGEITQTAQPVADGEGNLLLLDFPEYECENGHHWYQGEGSVRTIGGKDPILFEEHFQSRKRREIYTVVGTPDPSIVQGLYNRCHPAGRKVNSDQQRRVNGASFYR